MKLFKIVWRVYLKFSCCNFHDFKTKNRAIEFLKENPDWIGPKRLEIEL